MADAFTDKCPSPRDNKDAQRRTGDGKGDRGEQAVEHGEERLAGFPLNKKCPENAVRQSASSALVFAAISL
jgi:hypothetical protein